MRLLDLFCGMGGWSIGFHRAGFKCTGVDMTDWGYPYDFIQADIKGFHYPDFFDQQYAPKIDVVVASPPCQYYSQARNKLPRETERGDILVHEATRVIKEIHPRYWIIENVRGSVPHISKILGIEPAYSRGPQFLWGEFPRPLINDQSFRKLGFFDKNTKTDRMREDYIKIRQSIRSIVPLGLAGPIAEACKEKIIT